MDFKRFGQEKVEEQLMEDRKRKAEYLQSLHIDYFFGIFSPVFLFI
jgi:hypothetical protein